MIRPTSALLLVFPLLAGASGLARAESLKDTVPNVAVVGEATAEAVPDRALLRFGVVSEKASAAEAAAENARIAQAILDELKAMGIADADLQTQNVVLEPFFAEEPASIPKGKPKQVQRYRARNDLVARIKPATRAGEVAGKIVDKGVNSIEGVDFEFSDPAAKLDELRGAAVKDAQRRAQAYAEAAGVKLSRVLEIRPLDDAPPPAPFAMKTAMSAEARAVGDMPVRPGVQRLAARVSVVWALSR